ncbi:MAG: arsenosugar biosynthesis arsenite methyltransferase ArsM [Planctomycetota bacterium]
MTTADYHATVQDVYRDAAQVPADNLCCVPMAPQYLPGLSIPGVMHDMNYGCGATVHPQDMAEDQTVLYVGVGGGLELLQLAYYTRQPGGVIGVDPVAEMREACRQNLETAAEQNDWFDPSFIDLRDGDALDLPIDDNTVDFAAQNCLFNIFKTGGDLEKALGEMYRVLKKHGRLAMSDPVTPVELPDHLQNDELLRAQCISGSLTYDNYIKKITDTGFGSGEVRSRKPYRHLDAKTFNLPENVMLETVEVTAFKTPMPKDGPCVFTGRTATYFGPDKQFDDGKGHVLLRNMPLDVCDKTAGALAALNHPKIAVTESTYHYGGGGCC